jgi:endonuclease YncB( thermonuclease family)
MKKYILLIACLLFCQSVKAEGFTCIVNKVHDGDTFYCNQGPVVRIWGINSPEVPPVVNRFKAENNGGYKARDFVSKLVKNKKLECIPYHASYNRIVAQCFLNNEDIAPIIINSGNAKEDTEYSEGYYSDYKK